MIEVEVLEIGKDVGNIIQLQPTSYFASHVETLKRRLPSWDGLTWLILEVSDDRFRSLFIKPVVCNDDDDAMWYVPGGSRFTPIHHHQ